METMESLKRRVHTAQDLHSLVRTMKAMAAVNIRQLEHAVESLSDYKRTIELGLRVVLRQRDRSTVMSRTAPQQSLGTIVIGSDQGMCGQLNDQIVASAIKHINQFPIPADNRATLAVGMRGNATRRRWRAAGNQAACCQFKQRDYSTRPGHSDARRSLAYRAANRPHRHLLLRASFTGRLPPEPFRTATNRPPLAG